MNNYYETLGVSKNATREEIKTAYRKMAAKHHPDRGGDTATFQKIQAAYDVIGDEQRRQEYDNPAPQGFSFHSNGFGFNFNDIFGQHSPFAEVFRQQANRRPSYRTRVQVTLEQAALGEEIPIQINTPQSPNNGVFKIRVPQGIDTGQAVRYDNLIPNAELVVEFIVLSHPRFRRTGLDISTSHQISALELMVGTRIQVENIFGETFEVAIPPNISATSKLRVSKKGLRHNGEQGDHYVLIDIQIPATISETLRQAILSELNR